MEKYSNVIRGKQDIIQPPYRYLDLKLMFFCLGHKISLKFCPQISVTVAQQQWHYGVRCSRSTTNRGPKLGSRTENRVFTVRFLFINLFYLYFKYALTNSFIHHHKIPYTNTHIPLIPYTHLTCYYFPSFYCKFKKQITYLRSNRQRGI